MKKLLSLALMLCIIIALAAGCGTDAEKSPSPEPTSTPDKTDTPAQSDTGGQEEDIPQVTYPLVDEPTTFTCWWQLDVQDVPDLAETQYFKEAAKVTGVTLKFEHPSGASGEAFQLMMAAQDYPNMIQRFYNNYRQGVDFAIENDVVMPLNDYTEYMPNYMALINGNDEIKLNCYSDNGYLWCINQIVDKPQDPWCGPTVRKDLLEKVGFTKTPTTVDDWEEMLTLLKDNVPSLSTGPFQLCAHGATSVCGTLTAAYGIDQVGNFNIRDGKVFYSVLEPGFKDYLIKMNDWWNKGLIYNDFISEGFVYGPFNLVLNDKLAVFDSIYNFYDTNYKAASENPDFLLIGIPLPKLNPNDKLHVRNSNGWCRLDNALVITPTCENIPVACAYWDFAFSEQGKILGNWGVEGVSFEYDENGEPRYTDLVMKDANGPQSGMTKYVLFNAPGFCIPTREQQGLTDITNQAPITWVQSADNDWVYPAGAVLTSEEGSEFSALFTDIRSFVQENVNNFVMGNKPLSEFDSFINELKNMGIYRCIELKQAAADRYYNRLNVIKD